MVLFHFWFIVYLLYLYCRVNVQGYIIIQLNNWLVMPHQLLSLCLKQAERFFSLWGCKCE